MRWKEFGPGSPWRGARPGRVVKQVGPLHTLSPEKFQVREALDLLGEVAMLHDRLGSAASRDLLDVARRMYLDLGDNVVELHGDRP